MRKPSFYTLRRAFSLIEAAIVLGVVAVVIAGIWVAAATINSHMRINEAASSILVLAKATQERVIFDLYPSTFATGVSATALASKWSIAASFKYSGGNLVTSKGAVFALTLACWSATYPSPGCPMIAVVMLGPSVAGSKMTGEECVAIIRKLAALAKDRSDFLYVQIMTPTNSSYQTLSPPIDGASVDCPANFSGVNFWFRP